MQRRNVRKITNNSCTYGETVTQLPDGFVPYQQWSEHNACADVPPFMHPEQVGTSPIGRRWGLWPIMFEEYVSDTEPDLSVSDPQCKANNRIILWRRLTRNDIPKGWHQPSRTSSKLEGFFELRPDEEYWKKWSKSARYDRRRWHTELLNKKYIIESITIEEFEQTYTKSSIAQKIGKDIFYILKRKALDKNTAQYVELFGIRVIKTGEVIACMGIIHSPTRNASYYQAGCIRDTTMSEPIMLGLIDHWFAHEVTRSTRFLHAGYSWQKGETKSWKGFSQFKAKFGLCYIACSPLLVRFMRGKLF